MFSLKGYELRLLAKLTQTERSLRHSQVAAVTGAAANIGLAIAEAYAEAGADVAMLYSNNADAVKRAQEIAKKNSVKVVAYKVDGECNTVTCCAII